MKRAHVFAGVGTLVLIVFLCLTTGLLGAANGSYPEDSRRTIAQQESAFESHRGRFVLRAQVIRDDNEQVDYYTYTLTNIDYCGMLFFRVETRGHTALSRSSSTGWGESIELGSWLWEGAPAIMPAESKEFVIALRGPLVPTEGLAYVWAPSPCDAQQPVRTLVPGSAVEEKPTASTTITASDTAAAGRTMIAHQSVNAPTSSGVVHASVSVLREGTTGTDTYVYEVTYPTRGPAALAVSRNGMDSIELGALSGWTPQVEQERWAWTLESPPSANRSETGIFIVEISETTTASVSPVSVWVPEGDSASRIDLDLLCPAPLVGDRNAIGDPTPAIRTSPPPIAELIQIGEAGKDGMATIQGHAGAVPGYQHVLLASLDTGLFTTTRAGSDGSFEAQLFAPPGAHVSVKYTGNQEHLTQLVREAQPSGGGDWNVGNALPTTIIRVPISAATGSRSPAASEIPFAAAGQLTVGIGNHSDARWWIAGDLRSSTGLLVEPGDRLTIEGTVRIASSGLIDDPLPADFVATFDLAIAQLFDSAGRQVESLAQGMADHIFMSTLLTPTGLPLERDSECAAPRVGRADISSFRRISPSVVEGTLRLEGRVPSDLEDGLYLLRLAAFNSYLPTVPEVNYTMWELERHSNVAFLPILRVGDPETPRVRTMLMPYVYSGGARGTRSREDENEFQLSTMVAYQPGRSVVPAASTRTSAQIEHRLEPYLPMVSFAERRFPAVPLIPFDLPSGTIQVQIEDSDRSVRTLGPSALAQSYSYIPTNLLGKEAHTGAPFLSDMYSLTTLQDEFLHAFSSEGHHEIRMEGELYDVWGHRYSLGGTYDVWVAQELDIDPGQLPTTPYEVGDAFSPTVQVHPALPAEIEIEVTLLPNSDPDTAIVHHISGRANEHGYFHPKDDSLPIIMTTPGEFRVDIDATYVSEEGSCWAGSQRWGNVVETPNTPLVAHGRHGIDNAPGLGTQWFLWNELSPADRKDHIYYPFHRGDVLWADALDAPGGDSLIPALTIQDTVGQIESIIWERSSFAHSALSQGEVSLAERMSASEMPLVSTSSTGECPDRDPSLIDQWGYSYRSSERPGVRVREVVTEDSLVFGYWRYDDPYGYQLGNGQIEGDLPNDIKWQFGGAVFRDESRDIFEYAIYSAFWVLLPKYDRIGTRLMPPYRGSGGGPQDGGPLLTLDGKDIDVLFLPTGTRPGSTLEAGDTVSICGHVAPPLDSLVEIEITSPSGLVRSHQAHANKIGWFYVPEQDFLADEQGIWTVKIQVVHDRLYEPGGLIPTAYNRGSVLGAANGTYEFYVVDPTLPLVVCTPGDGRLVWPRDKLQPVVVTGRLPTDQDATEVSYSITMPGFILEQGTASVDGGLFTVTYHPEKLSQTFPNLDVVAIEEHRPGLADEVRLSLAAVNRDGRCFGNTITLIGEDVYVAVDGRCIVPATEYEEEAEGDAAAATTESKLPIAETPAASEPEPEQPPTGVWESVLENFDFELSSIWSWMHEVDESHSSLTARPGYLRIVSQTGEQAPPRGAIVVDAPSGDFLVETRVEFTPDENFERAGLLLYESREAFLVLCRAFCSFTDSGCVGNGIYFDSTLSTENFATGTVEQGVAWLRLRKRGDHVTGEYSEDGVTWEEIGTHQLPSTAMLRVGIVADGVRGESGEPADFDYVKIEALP